MYKFLPPTPPSKKKTRWDPELPSQPTKDIDTNKRFKSLSVRLERIKSQTAKAPDIIEHPVDSANNNTQGASEVTRAPVFKFNIKTGYFHLNKSQTPSCQRNIVRPFSTKTRHIWETYLYANEDIYTPDFELVHNIKTAYVRFAYHILGTTYLDTILDIISLFYTTIHPKLKRPRFMIKRPSTLDTITKKNPLDSREVFNPLTSDEHQRIFINNLVYVAGFDIHEIILEGAVALTMNIKLIRKKINWGNTQYRRFDIENNRPTDIQTAISHLPTGRFYRRNEDSTTSENTYEMNPYNYQHRKTWRMFLQGKIDHDMFRLHHQANTIPTEESLIGPKQPKSEHHNHLPTNINACKHTILLFILLLLFPLTLATTPLAFANMNASKITLPPTFTPPNTTGVHLIERCLYDIKKFTLLNPNLVVARRQISFDFLHKTLNGTEQILKTHDLYCNIQRDKTGIFTSPGHYGNKDLADSVCNSKNGRVPAVTSEVQAINLREFMTRKQLSSIYAGIYWDDTIKQLRIEINNEPLQPTEGVKYCKRFEVDPRYNYTNNTYHWVYTLNPYDELELCPIANTPRKKYTIICQVNAEEFRLYDKMCDERRQLYKASIASKQHALSKLDHSYQPPLDRHKRFAGLIIGGGIGVAVVSNEISQHVMIANLKKETQHLKETVIGHDAELEILHFNDQIVDANIKDLNHNLEELQDYTAKLSSSLEFYVKTSSLADWESVMTSITMARLTEITNILDTCKSTGRLALLSLSKQDLKKIRDDAKELTGKDISTDAFCRLNVIDNKLVVEYLFQIEDNEKKIALTEVTCLPTFDNGIRKDPIQPNRHLSLNIEGTAYTALTEMEFQICKISICKSTEPTRTSFDNKCGISNFYRQDNTCQYIESDSNENFIFQTQNSTYFSVKENTTLELHCDDNGSPGADAKYDLFQVHKIENSANCKFVLDDQIVNPSTETVIALPPENSTFVPPPGVIISKPHIDHVLIKPRRSTRSIDLLNIKPILDRNLPTLPRFATYNYTVLTDLIITFVVFIFLAIVIFACCCRRKTRHLIKEYYPPTRHPSVYSMHVERDEDIAGFTRPKPIIKSTSRSTIRAEDTEQSQSLTDTSIRVYPAVPDLQPQ